MPMLVARVPADMLEALRKLAQAHERPVSWVVRKLLEDSLKPEVDTADKS